MRLHTMPEEDVHVSEATASPSLITSWIVAALLVTVGLGITMLIPTAATTPSTPAMEEANVPENKPSLFQFLTRSVGAVFGPLLLIDAIFLAALVVLQALDLRVAIAIPAKFVEQFTDLVNRRRFKEAFDLVSRHPSFLAYVLRAGMGRLQYGLDEARQSADAMGEAMKASKGQPNDYLKIIAVVSPMLGLVAALCGIIGTLTSTSPTGPNWSAVIGQCLVPTVIG